MEVFREEEREGVMERMRVFFKEQRERVMEEMKVFILSQGKLYNDEKDGGFLGERHGLTNR